MTPEQIAQARHLRDDLRWPWRCIADKFQCDKTTVQRALDEEYRLKDNARKAKAERTRLRARRSINDLPTEDGVFRNPIYDPARDGPRRWESLAAYMLGEPAIGFRALDKR